ncbi:MAG: TonB-dependent receptor [Acidobacteriota bacterium]
MATETRIGASLSSAYLTRAGRLGNADKGSYLASLRRGWLDVVFGLVGPDDEEEEEGAPEYWDAYGKIDWQFDDATDGGIWTLWAEDRFDGQEREDGALEVVDSSYGNRWLVARGQRLWSPSAVTSARLFAGQVERERFASESEGSTDFMVRDDRELDVFGLASDTSLELGSRHVMSMGFEVRRYDASYDYRNARAFTDPIGAISDTEPTVRFLGEAAGEATSLWVSDRWRLSPRLVAEIGARYDHQSWIEDAGEDGDQISPRLGLAWDLGESGVVRAGWGHAHQSQRPNELRVEDGDTRFLAAERSEHRTLGWENAFTSGRRLRVDLFQRLGRDLQPRYENLFSPVVLFPEGSPDRVRLAPDRSRAQGLELFVQGKPRPRFNWWVTYTYSDVERRIEGAWIPSQTDQPHALTADVSFRVSRKWKLNAAWIYHTGWPISELTAELVDGPNGPDIRPILGPLYGERVDDYHRLDVRLSRQFDLGKGDLQLYFDIQNLYNRENERGYEFGEDAFLVQPDGSVRVEPEIDTWLGVVPSFGLTWSF